MKVDLPEKKKRGVQRPCLLLLAGLLGLGPVYGTGVGNALPGAGNKPANVEARQNGPVSGTVKDAAGTPLPGVSISLKGSSAGTVTDDDGRFTIYTQGVASPVLVLSYIGFQTQELAFGNRSVVEVVMREDAKALSEVVVVGYGTQKKVNLTGAVDQVTAEVFENRPIPNLSQGLQGVLPNLNLVPTDGKPIQSPTFNVRGTTSIGQGGNALVLIDGVEGDPSLLNPNDVASISVLKDASAAAIYGARGAFGVVLITTKNPSKDKTSVTYSGNYSVKSPTAIPDFVTDGYIFSKWFNEGWTAWNDYSQTPQNVNKTVKFSPAYLAELERRSADPSLPKVEVGPNGEYVYYANTDWFKELYKDNNSSTEHNVSVSGSSGKASFYATGRYFGQEGLFRYNSDDYTMYNFRAKGSLELFPWLRVDNNTNYSKMSYRNPLNVGEGGGIWRNIADEGHTMAPMFNPDGTLTYSAAYTVGDFWYGKNGIDMDERVIRNTTGLTATLLDNKFRLNGNFTFENRDNDETRVRVPVPYSRIPGVIEYVGTNTNDIQQTYRETSYLATNLYGEYETTFSDAHYFKAMAGYNYEQSTFQALQTMRNGLIFEDARDINLALGQSITTGGGWERWNIAGGFYRVNYAFKERYLLEASGRYDGSSKFPKEERFAFFPSFSAGWRISNEPFWQVSPNFISELKLRASYGSLGNGNISSYAFQEKFNISQSGRVLGGVRPQQTSQPSVIPAGLTWETSTTRNIGLDLSMLSNRLTFNGDAYIRKTTDMFTVGMSLPAVFGTAVPKGNYADLETKGWELSLNWQDQISLASKPFNYNVRLTLADYTAEITKYNNPDKKLSDYYAGQKVGEIWGYVTDGFFTSQEEINNSPSQKLIRASTSGQLLPGDIKFRDLNNDGVINNGDNTVDNPGDRKIIGNATPRYTYGVNLGFDWNNFFFTSFFQGVGKQDWYPGREAATFWGQYNRPYNKMPSWHLDNIWSEENPDAYLPRYRGYVAQNGSGELAQEQTKYLQNVAYIRLKNIQLGYNLPQHLIEKVGMSSARVFVSGENLWSWSPLYKLTKDLDVESIRGSDRVLTNGSSGNGYNYPILKSVTMGLSLTF
ncbi:TonB-linked SusC/RagA family outer membrane protein [Pontibacter mucosus]|uniref:TonB-linked SusC/RagA family outer membrane protein n=1 Tax=Pontibacter mucosus TaxID=1649266 RepID=A0A2T5Y3K0_9BACT|nr:TonB-dependent receptor [Pontibacter mucosus]PTX10704.1 TonB-linked SusC/RagA family outer membrane protein [Pontibacter mucosus]